MPRLDANPRIKIFQLVITRWLLVSVVLFGTYNPSGRSYYHWVIGSPEFSPAQLAVGILLFALLVSILRMAFLSTGFIGVTAIVLAVLMGLLSGIGLGLFEFDDLRFTIYTIEVIVSVVVAVALPWAYIQRRLSGERDVLRTPP